MLERISEELGRIPVAGLAALGIFAVAQIALQVCCLVDLARRPRVRYGRKWMWLLVILSGQLGGAIVYLAFARLPAVVADQPLPPAAAGQRARRALEVLYRRREEAS